MKDMKPMLAMVAAALLFSLPTVSACGPRSGAPRTESATASTPAVPATAEAAQGPQQPFDIAARFYSSGWMGDGAIPGAKYIQLDESWKKNPHSGPTCIKVQYSPGPRGWAGVYWQNKPDNWGNHPGENFSQARYKRVVFWARGETGGEMVEFKAGGITGKEYVDSFEVTTGKIALDKEWRQYSIRLEDRSLSSVIGGFCWVSSKSASGSGLTFYLDDIHYEF